MSFALFCCGDGDSLPVIYFFLSAFGGDFDFTAFAADRRDGIDAEFGSFLHDPVHFFATAEALYQSDLQLRLCVMLVGSGGHHCDLVFVNRINDAMESLLLIVE